MTASTELTVAEQPQQVALTALDRAVIALGGTEREDALKALAKKYADITEVKNKAGRQQVHAAAMELANERIATKKTGETAREDANALQKAVIERQKVLIGIVEPEEKRLLALRDKFDDAEEAERQAKAAAEQARINAIKARIEAFMLDAVSAIAGTVAEIDAYATRLSETVISLDEFFEYAGEAQVKRDNTVKWLRERQQHAIAQEAEAARLAAEREAIERQRAELAEQERKAAASRAEQESKDRAERERVEAEQRAAREHEEARLRAEREAAAAKLQADREAAEAELRKQREEIVRQQAEINAVKAEQERAERARLAAIEAEARAKREAVEEAERAEAARVQAEKDAVEAERIRRERADFLNVGPGDHEIIALVAKSYGVPYQTACNWIAKIEFVDFTDDEEKAA